jgi:hypothetical protein
MGRWIVGPRPITRIDVIRGKGHARPATAGALSGRWCCSAAAVDGGAFILCSPATLKDKVDLIRTKPAVKNKCNLSKPPSINVL